MSVADLKTVNPINVGTVSGGGAMGIWAWRTLMGLHTSGFPFQMIGGSSTGCIVAYMYAKGFWDEAEDLYKLTYEQGSRNIFEPGIAKIKDGKVKIDWGKALLSVFKIKNVKSLMTNKGLYETFLALERKKPGFPVADMFFNTTSLQTGLGQQHASSDYLRKPEALCAAMTASTAMPGILPWYEFDEYKFMVDGGVTDGLPFKQMFNRMDPMKDYQFFNVMCNPLELMPANELSNAAQVIGRTVSVMLLEILKGDLERTEDRNNIAKIIWPITDRLEKICRSLTSDNADQIKEILEIVQILRATLGYRHMPIYNVICSKQRGVFDFTVESYQDQLLTAQKDVSDILQLISGQQSAA